MSPLLYLSNLEQLANLEHVILHGRQQKNQKNKQAENKKKYKFNYDNDI